MLYEELEAINARYLNSHVLTDGDLEMVTRYQLLISEFHNNNHTPQVGDLVEGAYWDGAYPYHCGIIERINSDGTLSICYQPMIPFVYYDAKENRLSLSVSGGPFGCHHADDLELVANDAEALFCRFGSCGACANGALNFKATVRRWRIPYKWKSHTFVTEIIETEWWDRDYTIYIGGNPMCNDATFKNRQQLDDFLEKYGLTLSEECSWPTGRKWRLSHNFANKYFWKLDELPENVKHIYGMCNGSLVDCYVQVTEHEVITWRPNPNAKEVYKPYDREGEQYKAYKQQCEYI